MARSIYSLHVVDRAQLGIDEHVQIVQEVIEQEHSLLVEHLPVLLPLRLDLRGRGLSILANVVCRKLVRNAR